MDRLNFVRLGGSSRQGEDIPGPRRHEYAFPGAVLAGPERAAQFGIGVPGPHASLQQTPVHVRIVLLEQSKQHVLDPDVVVVVVPARLFGCAQDAPRCRVRIGAAAENLHCDGPGRSLISRTFLPFPARCATNRVCDPRAIAAREACASLRHVDAPVPRKKMRAYSSRAEFRSQNRCSSRGSNAPALSAYSSGGWGLRSKPSSAGGLLGLEFDATGPRARRGPDCAECARADRRTAAIAVDAARGSTALCSALVAARDNDNLQIYAAAAGQAIGAVQQAPFAGGAEQPGTDAVPRLITPAAATVPVSNPQYASTLAGSVQQAAGTVPAPYAQFASQPAGPNTPPSPAGVSPNDILGRLQAAEAELNAMRQQMATRDQKLGEFAEEAKKAVAMAGEKPLPLVRLSGFFQYDTGLFTQNAESRDALGNIQNGSGFRRTRLQGLGQLTEFTTFSIEMDFAFAGRPSFMDVWGEQSNLPILGHLPHRPIPPAGDDGLVDQHQAPGIHGTILAVHRDGPVPPRRPHGMGQ